PAQSPVVDVPGLRLRPAPAARAPETPERERDRQPGRPARLQRPHRIPVGPAGAPLSAAERAARHGAAPDRVALQFGALRLPPGPGDVLLLWPAQPAHVQRRLSQRAPRFSVHRGLAAAPPAAARSGILRPLDAPRLVDGHVVALRARAAAGRP